MSMNARQTMGRLGMLLLASTLVACGGNQVRTGDATSTRGPAGSQKAAEVASGSTLEERATRRWQLLIDGKPDLAYEYFSPGYKQTRSREEYTELMHRRPVKWVSVHYQDQDCDGEICKVRLMIGYTLDMPVQMVGRVESVDFVTENWLWMDGDWYHLPASDARQGLR